MSPREIGWGKPQETQKLEGHSDYLRNLLDAKAFIQNTQKSLLEGLSVTLTDEERVLMIGFRPPRHHPMGNYAAPVNLHQSRGVVQNETQWYFNYHYRLADMFTPKQVEF